MKKVSCNLDIYEVFDEMKAGSQPDWVKEMMYETINPLRKYANPAYGYKLVSGKVVENQLQLNIDCHATNLPIGAKMGKKLQETTRFAVYVCTAGKGSEYALDEVWERRDKRMNNFARYAGRVILKKVYAEMLKAMDVLPECNGLAPIHVLQYSPDHYIRFAQDDEEWEWSEELCGSLLSMLETEGCEVSLHWRNRLEPYLSVCGVLSIE